MPDPDLVTRLRTVFVSHHDVEMMTREAADEIERLNSECTRLACRNAVLVLEIDRIRAGNARLRNDLESAVRIALYEGEG